MGSRGVLYVLRGTEGFGGSNRVRRDLDVTGGFWRFPKGFRAFWRGLFDPEMSVGVQRGLFVPEEYRSFQRGLELSEGVHRGSDTSKDLSGPLWNTPDPSGLVLPFSYPYQCPSFEGQSPKTQTNK